MAACGGIFRGSKGEYVSSFSDFLGLQNCLHAELMGVIYAIECAQKEKFPHLWLERDSVWCVKLLIIKI